MLDRPCGDMLIFWDIDKDHCRFQVDDNALLDVKKLLQA